MAHGVLKELDSEKESTEDFRERFDFYFMENKLRNEGKDMRWNKPLLLTFRPQYLLEAENIGESHSGELPYNRSHNGVAGGALQTSENRDCSMF